MTTNHTCDAVAERLALGEPLDSHAAHIATCTGCTRLVEMPRRIGAARQDLDPGLGFSARMTAGAQHLIGVRRRRRVAAGLAATVAAGLVGVVVLTRDPRGADPALAVKLPEQPTQPTEDDPVVQLPEDDLAALVNLADTQRSLRLSANWKGIEQPLAPYRKLVKHTQGEAP